MLGVDPGVRRDDVGHGVRRDDVGHGVRRDDVDPGVRRADVGHGVRRDDSWHRHPGECRDPPHARRQCPSCEPEKATPLLCATAPTPPTDGGIHQ